MTCEDICQKVRGGVNTMEVSGVWSWQRVVKGYRWHVERGGIDRLGGE
jgi:hypothetical protein